MKNLIKTSLVIGSLVFGGASYASDFCHKYAEAAREVMELRQLDFRPDVVVRVSKKEFPEVEKHIESLTSYAFTFPEERNYSNKFKLAHLFSAKAHDGCMKSDLSGQ